MTFGRGRARRATAQPGFISLLEGHYRWETVTVNSGLPGPQGMQRNVDVGCTLLNSTQI